MSLEVTSKARHLFAWYHTFMKISSRLFKSKRKPARRSQKAAENTWKRQVGIGVMLTCIIGLILTGVWYGSRVESLTINTIEVVGGETIARDEVRRLTDELLVGSYYRLVPKQFAFTYPKQTITDRIMRLERVKNVLVERLDGTTLQIVFEEYKPFALWCESLESTSCAFLDRSGYAFTMAPELTGAAFIRYVVVDEELETGKQVFDRSILDQATEFTEAASDQLSLNVIGVIQTSVVELEYHLAGGGIIRTSRDVTAQDTFENLLTVLESTQFDHLEPGNFEYIDLRFGNKVYVKEESVEISTSTASATQI